MTKTFPIIVPAAEHRTPVRRHAEPETGNEPTYHPLASFVKWKTAEVILVALLLYGAFAAAHGLQYDPENYVCHHMARDMEDLLESFGIKVTIVTGWNNLTNGTEITSGSNGHAWIKVGGIDIDSVWLIPFPMRWQYPHKGKEYDDYTDYARNIYTEKEFMERALAGKL